MISIDVNVKKYKSQLLSPEKVKKMSGFMEKKAVHELKA